METATAGTTILMEFQNYGRSPAGSTPTRAVDHAERHGSMVHVFGSATMCPPVISARGFSELASMMKIGSR